MGNGGWRHNRRGQSLIELVVTVGVFAIVGGAAVMLVVNALRSGAAGGDRTMALGYARESWEAVKSIARDSFNELETGTHGLTDEKGYWEFKGEFDEQGRFTRQVDIDDVLRDENGDIAEEGTRDIHTRKVTTTVSWDTLGRHVALTVTNYITDWDNARIFEDTVEDFEDGSFDDTKVTENDDGEVELENAPGTFECSPFISSLNLKKGHIGGDSAYTFDTTISGKVAYIVSSEREHNDEGAGTWFSSWSVSNPLKPARLGKLKLEDRDEAHDIAFADGYAYVGMDRGTDEIIVVQSMDSKRPVVSSVLELPGDANVRDLYVDTAENLLIVSTVANAGGGEVLIYDIATAGTPTFVSEFEVGADVNGVWKELTKMYLATADSARELMVVNVASAFSPTLLASYDAVGSRLGDDVVAEGSTVFLALQGSATALDPELIILDAAVPTSMGVLSETSLVSGTEHVNDMAIDLSTEILFVVVDKNEGTEAKLLSVLDRTAPEIDTEREFGASMRGVAIEDEVSVFAVDRVSKKAPASVAVLLNSGGDYSCSVRAGTNDFPGGADVFDVAVSDRYAYTVRKDSGEDEVVVVDVIDPAAPSRSGSFNLEKTGNAIALSGNYAFVATEIDHKELTVLSLSVPTAPTEVGSLDLLEDAYAITIIGSRAYVGLKNAGTGNDFVIIDISTPTLPVLRGGYDVASNVRGIAVDGTHAYLATSGAELMILDIATETAISTVGTLDLSQDADAYSVAKQGSYAFLVRASSGATEFNVIDVSAVTAPALVAGRELATTSRDLVVTENDLAFVGTDKNQVRVFNIENPLSPVLNSTIKTRKAARGIAIEEGTMYVVGTGDPEFEIFQDTTPQSDAFRDAGTYESSVFNVGGPANWSTISWGTDLDACEPGEINLQIRTAETVGELAVERWQGSDGEDEDEEDVYDDNTGTLIHPSHNGDQYIQYRATFEGDNSCTLALEDITITYAPF